MTLDYKTIKEVLRLEKEGFIDLDIADLLGFDPQELIEHKVSTIEAIDDSISNEIKDSIKIAENLNLPLLYIEELSLEYALPVKLERDNMIHLMKYISLSKKNWRRKEAHQTSKKPKTQEKEIERIEKLDNLILYVGRKSNYFGKRLHLHGETDYPITYSVNGEEFENIKNQALRAGYLKQPTSGGNAELAWEGWNKFEQLKDAGILIVENMFI